MKFFTLKLLVISFMMLAASSAFASLGYNVSFDTSSLNGQDGFLYLQYGGFNAANSTATVSNFSTDGILASGPSSNVVDGSAVTGQLPGKLVFANTNGTNDYNHGINFGNKIDFSVLFASNDFAASPSGNSTFSLGLYSDEAGLNSLLGGTLLTVDLNNDGTTTVQSLAKETSATPTPIPAAAWLLGSGLMGLVGVRRRKK